MADTWQEWELARVAELDMGSWYEPPDDAPYCQECTGDEHYCPLCQHWCDEEDDEDDGDDGPYDTWQEWELDHE